MHEKPVILIVEDEIALVEILQDKLVNNGFDVLIAKNGEVGLKVIKEQKVDLVLLDIIMPKMDGVTMLKHLRQDENDNTPVIVLTNLGSDDDAKDALKLGANDFLIKSDHSLEEVIDKVKHHLKIK